MDYLKTWKIVTIICCRRATAFVSECFYCAETVLKIGQNAIQELVVSCQFSAVILTEVLNILICIRPSDSPIHEVSLYSLIFLYFKLTKFNES